MLRSGLLVFFSSVVCLAFIREFDGSMVFLGLVYPRGGAEELFIRRYGASGVFMAFLGVPFVQGVLGYQLEVCFLRSVWDGYWGFSVVGEQYGWGPSTIVLFRRVEVRAVLRCVFVETGL